MTFRSFIFPFAAIAIILPLASSGYADDDKLSPEDLLFEKIPLIYAAARFEQSISEAPATVSVIDAEEIKNYGYRNLYDALKSVPGLYVVYDRNYQYLGIRGYYFPGDYNSRVLLMVGGQSFNEIESGSAMIGSGFLLDLDQVQRVEVIMGPGSALYGTNALFGVINVVSKEIDQARGVRAALEYGSYQSKKGQLSYGGEFGDLKIVCAGSYLHTKGQDLYYPEYDGYVDDNNDTLDGWFRNGDREKTYKGYLNLGWQQLDFQGGYSLRDKGIPTGAYYTIFNDTLNFNVDEYQFYDLKYAPVLGPAKDLSARVFHKRYRYAGKWTMWYTDSIGPYRQLSQDLETGTATGAETQFNWETFRRNRLTLGGNIQHNQSFLKYWDQGYRADEDYQYVYSEESHGFTNWSVFAQDIYKIWRMSFILGGRHDGYQTSGVTFNPRLGWILNASPKTTLKVLYGTSFRAPTPYEMYYNDGGYSQLPNEDLRPEKLATTEVVFEQGFLDNALAAVSAYRTEMSDLIYQVPTADTGAAGEPMLQFQNVGQAQALGLELRGRAEFRGLQLKAGFNLQRTVDQNTDLTFVNSPDHQANLSVSLPFLSDRIRLSGEMNYLGPRLTLDRQRLDPYSVINLTLLLRRFIPRLEISLRCNNLLDQEYYDPCGSEHLQTRILQDGRNFLVKTTLSF